MTSHEDVEAAVLAQLINADFKSDEAQKMLRIYTGLASHRPKPPPTPEPEKEEVKVSWFESHSDQLIKSGFTLLGVLAIVAGEKLGQHLYNTKAWNAFSK